MIYLPDDTNWSVTEFADAELGDERRTQRLVALADVLAQHPTAALPEACGDRAMLKAAYRFFDNDAVEPQDVLLSHIEATYGRLAARLLELRRRRSTRSRAACHSQRPPLPADLTVTHKFYYRASWGMMGTSNPDSRPKSDPLTKETGMIYLPDDTNWSVTEFADAELGDERRTQRLVALADVLAQHPTAALPEACGDRAMLKAAYRFFDNDAVEPQDVLLSHIEALGTALSPWARTPSVSCGKCACVVSASLTAACRAMCAWGSDMV